MLVLLARGLAPGWFAVVISVNVALQVTVAVNGFGLLRQIEYRRSRNKDDPDLASLFAMRLAFSWASAVGWIVLCLAMYAWTGSVFCHRPAAGGVLAAGRADDPGLERRLRSPTATPAPWSAPTSPGGCPSSSRWSPRWSSTAGWCRRGRSAWPRARCCPTPGATTSRSRGPG